MTNKDTAYLMQLLKETDDVIAHCFSFGTKNHSPVVGMVTSDFYRSFLKVKMELYCLLDIPHPLANEEIKTEVQKVIPTDLEDSIKKFIDLPEEINISLFGKEFCVHEYYDGLYRITCDGKEVQEYVHGTEIINVINKELNE